MPTTVVCLKRVDGKVKQDCDIYIGRRMYAAGWRLPGSKWANPYKLPKKATKAQRDAVLCKYRMHIRKSPELMNSLEELRDKRLGCWCHPHSCHGDILIELMNDKARAGAIVDVPAPSVANSEPINTPVHAPADVPKDPEEPVQPEEEEEESDDSSSVSSDGASPPSAEHLNPV
jgi:hypothetical protein